MAAGKTSIGRHLARELGVAFFDTDALIVARHGAIPALFESHGEELFRAFEFDAVSEALAGPPCVVALGGGAVTHAPTRALLARRALRVYLEIPAEILHERLQRSRARRPVIGDTPTIERVRELLGAREALYHESDITVRGPLRTQAAFAREIANRLRES